MPLSDAQICTVALARVGEKQPIDSLNATTSSARLCKAIYELARDAALEEFPWPFATRRALLAVLADEATDAAARTGWAYTYSLPADCLAPRYLVTGLEGTENVDPSLQPAFEVEDDAVEGRVLVTNQEDAELVYTVRQDNPGKFTPLFCDALAWRIAYELALSLPVKAPLAQMCWQMYQVKVQEAAAATFKHMKESPATPASVRARR